MFDNEDDIDDYDAMNATRVNRFDRKPTSRMTSEHGRDARRGGSKGRVCEGKPNGVDCPAMCNGRHDICLTCLNHGKRTGRLDKKKGAPQFFRRDGGGESGARYNPNPSDRKRPHAMLATENGHTSEEGEHEESEAHGEEWEEYEAFLAFRDMKSKHLAKSRAGQDKKSKKDKTSAKHSLNKALQAHLARQEDSDDDDAHVA